MRAQSVVVLTGCSCTPTGSNNPSQCAKYGGQCECKPSVMGRTCNKCVPDYFNFASGQGCQGMQVDGVKVKQGLHDFG